MFNIRFGKIWFGFWRVTFLKRFFFFFFFFFTTWKPWDGLTYHVRIEMRRSLLSFNMCWNFQKYPRTKDRERNRTFSQICFYLLTESTSNQAILLLKTHLHDCLGVEETQGSSRLSGNYSVKPSQFVDFYSTWINTSETWHILLLCWNFDTNF